MTSKEGKICIINSQYIPERKEWESIHGIGSLVQYPEETAVKGHFLVVFRLIYRYFLAAYR